MRNRSNWTSANKTRAVDFEELKYERRRCDFLKISTNYVFDVFEEIIQNPSISLLDKMP